MIILDAGVLIAHFNARDAHHDQATRLLLDRTEDRLAASAVTNAEILVGPSRSGLVDQAEQALRDLGIDTIGLDVRTPARLAALRVRTQLKLPDWCVLPAAERAAATTVATFDQRLAASAQRLDFGVARRRSVHGGEL